MRTAQAWTRWAAALALVACAWAATPASGAEWVDAYAAGLRSMDAGDWNGAVTGFQRALAIKNVDSDKVRAYGTVFIAYYPHRELGIAYFNLGDLAHARTELSASLAQSFSQRAEDYLERIMAGGTPAPPSPAGGTPSPSTPPAATPAPASGTPPSSPAAGSATTAVGERLSVAVLPFESKDIGADLGSIDLLDKLVTGFVNSGRFKVIERAQLEKILNEQKLGLTGVLDASTAAQIGKGIGVDGVVVGSITRSGNTVTIDARLIDTESAAILTARDAFSNGISLQDLSQMITELVGKIQADLPMVSGYVIRVDGANLTLDIGTKNGIRKGIKCLVYREGAPMVHPVTGEVIGKMIDEICEVQVTDVFDGYCTATVTKSKSGEPEIRDRVTTK